MGPLFLIGLCALLFALEPLSNTVLAFDREKIRQFQLWRMVTGNLLHTNFHHLLLNLSGVLLLWALHGYYFTTARYLYLVLYCSVVTAVGLMVFSPNMLWYVGLSGTLHGLFTLGAYYDVKHRLKSGWLLLIGVSIKVAYEQLAGPSEDLARLIDANVAIDAHLYGYLAGLSLIMLLSLVSGKKAGTSQP